MRRKINLTVFDEASPAGAPAAQAAEPAKQTPAQPSGTYSYAQAEEIATARAERAEKAALASYFKQQGMTEDEATEAIKAYKAAQKAKEPDVAALQRDLDDKNAKLAAYEQRDTLGKKGVKAEFADYVAFMARGLMAKDDKLDFDKAADKFLKDNPQYAGPKQAYRIKTASEQGAGSSQPKSKDEIAADARAALNAALKNAARRR